MTAAPQAGPAPVPVSAGGQENVLELETVTKIYPSSPPVTALRGVSVTVTAGELVAVLGPSGSGKSTLLHLMGTLDRPSAGTVRVTGLDVAALSDRELAGMRATRIGFVFQQYFLAEHQTALDNLADGLLYAGTGLAERRRRAMDALALVGLAGRPGARPTQLSGGQRQRVAIARALAGRPAIVLADEPTGNLDSKTGGEILELMRSMVDGYGQTTVMVTHEARAAAIADRILFLADGLIVRELGRGAQPAEVLEVMNSLGA